ncbi:MAG: NADH-quinone oxidoreductase subunit N, partial [Hyphomicrobium sp.]
MDFSLFAPVVPELILALGALALLMVGAFSRDGVVAGRVTAWLAIAVLLTAAVYAASSASGLVFEGAFVSDGLTRFLKVLVLIAAALTLLLTFDDFGRARVMLFEYPVLVLLATLGMMMMISANDLIALYLGLELQSLALYV